MRTQAAVSKTTATSGAQSKGSALGSNTVSYLYNGLGQRVSKLGPTSLVPTGAAYYAYDEAGQLTGEYNASAGPIYETVYLGSTPVAALQQSGSAASSTLVTAVYNVYADHIDTPRVITRSTDDAIVWRWDTAEAFGATTPNQNPNGIGSFSFNQRFPGQLFDQETGNFYNWWRTYNPTLGRYDSFDPLGLAAGINGFVYVENQPTRYVDPNVLVKVCSVLTGACWDTNPPPFNPDVPPSTPAPGWKPLFPKAPAAPFCKVDEFDKKLCDDYHEQDVDSCHDQYGRGLRGSGFGSALGACLGHAETRRNACYAGQRDPGPFNGNAWPGGKNR